MQKFKKHLLTHDFMENYVFDDEENAEKILEDEESSSDDEGFMKGYNDEAEANECAECGTAVTEEKKVVRKIEEDEYVFCSASCADEFEESMGQ